MFDSPVPLVSGAISGFCSGMSRAVVSTGSVARRHKRGMHPLAVIGFLAIALVQLLQLGEPLPPPPPAASVLAEPVAETRAALSLVGAAWEVAVRALG